MTDAEIEAEAARLVALTEPEREAESVRVALRIGRNSEESANELAALDRKMLKAYVDDPRILEILDG